MCENKILGAILICGSLYFLWLGMNGLIFKAISTAYRGNIHYFHGTKAVGVGIYFIGASILFAGYGIKHITKNNRILIFGWILGASLGIFGTVYSFYE